jgi:hypothetical protein
MLKQSFLIITFSAILIRAASAQTDSSKVDSVSVQKAVLIDDTELIGRVIYDDGSRMKFKTLAGIEMEFDKSSVKEIKDVEGAWDGKTFLRSDPNKTRLFFAPTARTLKQGEGYFAAYEIFFPFLAVGLTDFITLSGGVSLFPGASEQIVYIGPKIRFIHLENFDFSGGIIYSHVSDSDFGITYGIASYGSSKASLTLGLGWGYEDGEFSDRPFVLAGGEVQLSNSIKLLTENWFLPETVVISFGIRFFGENLAADFGLMTVTEETEGFPFLPWIGFAYNF